MWTRKVLISFIAAFCFLNTAYVLAQQTIVLNTTGIHPLNNPERNGFMDRVSVEAFKEINYKLDTTVLPAERGLKSANEGVVDGEMSRIAGLNRVYPNLIQVPEPIMEWEFVVFSKKDIDMSSGWGSLESKYVAFITGWKILERNIPSTANITKIRDSDQLFRLLKKNRTDYVIFEKWGGLSVKKELDLDAVLQRPPALAKRKMYIYLHQKHKALVPKLSLVLKKMKRDGRYQARFNKILKPYISNK